MNVKQRFFVLFFLKKGQALHDPRRSLFCRITIDGLREEISFSYKIAPEEWDNINKLVLPTHSKWKEINKKMNQASVDIERHFDLLQLKHEIATPAMVKKSYLSPLSAQQVKNEIGENLAFDDALDAMIKKYIQFCEEYRRLHANPRMLHRLKAQALEAEKHAIKKEVNQLAREGNAIFDNKDHQKTFMLVVNEYLLNFLQLSLTGHRSANTLEKWMGRKKKYQEFLVFRYRVRDMALSEIQYSFIEQVFRHFLTQYQMIENTAMKYAQCVKEMMDRAVARGWIAANLFTIFKCRYKDPQHDWLTMQEMETLRSMQFEKDKLNVIRDIFVFESFTGLAYSDIRNLVPTDIIIGVDGKKWISKNRQKTGGDETLPLLPIAVALLDKYKDYPICVRNNRLLPVPSNEEYNRCLKLIGTAAGFKTILRTHKARFFFANEVAYNNGVPLKTISRMLGQKSVKTTEIYVRANREVIASSMDMVEQKLFTKDGELKTSRKKQLHEKENEISIANITDPSNGKVVSMQQRTNN